MNDEIKVDWDALNKESLINTMNELDCKTIKKPKGKCEKHGEVYYTITFSEEKIFCAECVGEMYSAHCHEVTE